MIIEDSIKIGAGYLVRLPRFTAEAGDYPLQRMNTFYSRLESEIIRYTESTAEVRRYKADYRIDESDGKRLRITVTLSARFKKRNECAESRCKSFSQVWECGTLKEHRIT